MLKTELAEIIKGIAGESLSINGAVEYPRDQGHGDYASTIALKLAKLENKPPREIAEKLAAKLEDLLPDYELSIAGPGFINFKLKPSALLRELAMFLQDPKSRLPKLTARKRIICEYSDPNIAKPLGIHHLLATIIGQAIANLYDYLGYEVVKINHIGDWGTQFGKLIYAIKTWGNREIIEKDPISELMKLYVRFHDEAEKNQEIVDFGRAEFQKLEAGDSTNRELWEWIVRESMIDVQKTYDALGGIEFDHTIGESFYENKMESLIQEGLEKEIFSIGEGGAIVANFPEENYPTTIVKRSDGATVYLTRDIATVAYRLERWQPEQIFYVVDVAQKLHFEQLFSISQRLMGDKLNQSHLEHVLFGRMSFSDKKMSTRKGNIIKLDDVIAEAIERAQKIVQSKNPTLEDSTMQQISKIVGVGCLKYAILTQNRLTNIVFSWEKIISLDGNSAAYLQYTYARARKVLEEAKNLGLDTKFSASDNIAKLTTFEESLLRQIPKFAEYIDLAATELKPNFLCEYLFGLAQAYNAFYTENPILNATDNEKPLRLALCKATVTILETGLTLLAGISCPERM